MQWSQRGTTSTGSPITPGKPSAEEDAQLQRTRIRALAAVLVVQTIFTALGPLLICGIGVAVSSVVLTWAEPDRHIPLLGIVWFAAAMISGMIVGGISLIGRRRRELDDQ